MSMTTLYFAPAAPLAPPEQQAIHWGCQPWS
jgi:hypothetical protein